MACFLSTTAWAVKRGVPMGSRSWLSDKSAEVRALVNSFIPARPFDFPYDRRLDPAAVALLVIDLQVDFLSPDGYFAHKGYDPAPLRAILPNVNRLIGAAR